MSHSDTHMEMHTHLNEADLIEVRLTSEHGEQRVHVLDHRHFANARIADAVHKRKTPHGCVALCPRLQLDPKCQLGDFDLMSSFYRNVRGSCDTYTPAVYMLALTGLSDCPCNKVSYVDIVRTSATFYDCGREFYEIAQKSESAFQLGGAHYIATELSKPLHPTARELSKPLHEKLRVLVRSAVRTHGLCGFLQENMRPVASRLHTAILELQNLLQVSEPIRAIKALSHDPGRQHVLMEWTLLMWVSYHALMTGIVKGMMKPVADGCADELIADELASKTQKLALKVQKTRRAREQSMPEVPDLPDDLFVCPLNKRLLTDPVIAADGHTYEREAMEGWLLTSDVSPVTQTKLHHTRLVSNISVRNMLSMLDWSPISA